MNKSWNYKNVISPFYRLYLIDEGVGMLSNPKHSLKLEKGFLYLIPSFTIVNQTCPSTLGQYYVHFIESTPDGNSLFAYCRKLMKIKAGQTDLAQFHRLLELNDFKEKNAKLPLFAIMETQGLIMLLLSRFLASDQYNPGQQEPIPSNILESINYIQTHLATLLTVEHLAKRANLSIDYFSKCFYRHTGLRPLQYIHQKRIERAQFLILTTHLSFSAIAENTGFESHSYFSRIFKTQTYQSPGAYRKNHSRLLQ